MEWEKFTASASVYGMVQQCPPIGDGDVSENHLLM